MREDRKRHEPRGSKRSGQSETKELAELWLFAFDAGYEEGFEAGVEEAKQQFMQTQLLLLHTGGNA